MNRRLLAAAGALALTLVVSACSTVQPDAARVDGTNISQADFEDRLSSIVDDPQFATNANLKNADTGQVNNEFARQLLFVTVFGTYARDRNEAAGVTPPTDDEFQQNVQATSAQVMGFDPASGQWATVADENRTPVEDDVREILTFLRSFQAQADDAAAVQAFYDADPSKFALLCARHILVPTQAEAEAVVTRLTAGEDFGAVAADVSTDTASAADGGRLYLQGQDCPAASTFVDPFTARALETPIGQVSEPVQTEFGWHVIITDQVVDRPLADIGTEVAEHMRSTAGSRASAEFGDAKVWINPRWGVWDPEAGFIEAPTTPGIAG